MPRSEAENQRLREQQRANILNAAMRVFARRGPSASMAEIAEAAGVSQGLAYRYFASKEEIYYALVTEAMRHSLSEAASDRIASGAPWERLTTLISLILVPRQEHPEFFQLLYHVLSDPDAPAELRARMRERGQFFVSALRDLIAQGQAAGEIAGGDPDQLVVAFMAYLDGLTRISLYDPARYKAHFPDSAIVLRMFRPGLDGSDATHERKQGDDVWATRGRRGHRGRASGEAIPPRARQRGG
jgi:AcrR family transcriptional regulator